MGLQLGFEALSTQSALDLQTHNRKFVPLILGLQGLKSINVHQLGVPEIPDFGTGILHVVPRWLHYFLVFFSHRVLATNSKLCSHFGLNWRLYDGALVVQAFALTSVCVGLGRW